jgi:hypothetical protein
MGGANSISNQDSLLHELASTVVLCHSFRVKDVITALSSAEKKILVNDIRIITEDSANQSSLHDVSEILGNVKQFVIILDALALYSERFLDLLSYVKGLKKPLYSTKLDGYFNPKGAAAAICVAYGTWFEDMKELFHLVLPNLTISHFNEPPLAFPDAYSPKNVVSPEFDICFSFANDVGEYIAKYLTQMSYEMRSQKLLFPSPSVLLSNNLEEDTKLMSKSKVLALVITADSLTSSIQLAHYKGASQLNMPILPILCDTWISGWLGLAMAGKLYYTVSPDKLDNLHKKFVELRECPIQLADSTPGIELIRAAHGLVMEAIKPRHSMEEYEDEIVRRMTTVATYLGISSSALEQVSIKNSSDVFIPEHVQLPSISSLVPAKQSVEMANIHYTISRLDVPPVKPVLDDYGLPVFNQLLDAMFSYEWASQSLVLDIYQQCNHCSARIWLDVMGNMQGNINAAMATAVETVACMVVFVTERYQNSINCQLEVKYAVSCKKPIIFALLEGRNAVIQPWLQELMGDCDIYPLLIDQAPNSNSKYFILDFSEKMFHGVPITYALCEIIRKYAAWRATLPLEPCRYSTLAVYLKTCAILKLIKTSEDSSITCTRCGVKFNPNLPQELKCRKHSAYYVGGTLITGRWVCCNSTEKNGIGCRPANHITVTRCLVLDPSYGTYSWSPG